MYFLSFYSTIYVYRLILNLFPENTGNAFIFFTNALALASHPGLPFAGFFAAVEFPLLQKKAAAAKKMLQPRYEAGITWRNCRYLVVAEGLSDFGNYSRTRDSIPDVGKQFRTTSRYLKTVSDVGEQFPISENSFRSRETVSGIGKRFPMSENSFRYRKMVSDAGKQFRYWETVYAVGEHLDRFEQIRTEQESRLYYRSSQERIKKVFYSLWI